MADEQVHRYEFRIGDVFPAGYKTSRYVMRLSMALGDLRIAIAAYAVREEQSEAERLYFVRLGASHLRELVLLLDPPDRRVVPALDEFIASLPVEARNEDEEVLRRSHAEVMRLLEEPLALRPGVTLRDELKRLRNQFFHYHADARNEPALIDAMTAAADEDGAYVTTEIDDSITMRAQYADTVASHLVHPFGEPQAEGMAREMHARIIELIKPLNEYLHQAEAAWLRSRPAGTVTGVFPDGSTADPRY